MDKTNVTNKIKKSKNHLLLITNYKNYIEYEFNVDKNYNHDKYIDQDPGKLFYVIIPVSGCKLLMTISNYIQDNQFEFIIGGITKTNMISSKYITIADVGTLGNKIIYYHEYAKLSIIDRENKLCANSYPYISNWNAVETICTEALKYFFTGRSSCDHESWSRSGEIRLFIS